MESDIEGLTAIWKTFGLQQALQKWVPDFETWKWGTSGMRTGITSARLIGSAGVARKAYPLAPRDARLVFRLALLTWGLFSFMLDIVNIAK
jgi:hypothetical protein